MQTKTFGTEERREKEKSKSKGKTFNTTEEKEETVDRKREDRREDTA